MLVPTPNSIASNFSRAARFYDKEATLQMRVTDELFDLISSCPDTTFVLELGCGTGYMAEKIISELSPKSYLGVDFAPQMIEMAGRRLTNYKSDCKIDLKEQDISTFRPVGPYSLVVSSSTLHWIENISEVFSSVASSLAKGGQFVFSLMLEGTLAELNKARQLISDSEDTEAISFPKSADILELLSENGFEVLHSTECIHQEIFDNPAQFLKSLKKRGVHGKLNKIPPFSFAKSNKVLKILGSSSGGPFKCSYNVGTFVARKSAVKTR